MADSKFKANAGIASPIIYVSQANLPGNVTYETLPIVQLNSSEPIVVDEVDGDFKTANYLVAIQQPGCFSSHRFNVVYTTSAVSLGTVSSASTLSQPLLAPEDFTFRTTNFTGTNHIVSAIGFGINTMVIGASENGQIRTSTSAPYASWTTRASNLAPISSIGINSIAYGNGVFLAASNNGEHRSSTDSVTWATLSSGFGRGQTVIMDIAYGNGLWVASGGFSPGEAKIFTSTDATTWTDRTTSTALFQNSAEGHVAKFGNGIFIVGTPESQSTDGITWTTTSGVRSLMKDIVYGNGIWVAVGSSGTGLVMTSTDTVTWTTRTSNAIDNFLTCVEHGNGVFVLGGRVGQLRQSTDGITWTTITSNISTSSIIWDVRYANNVWVAVADGGAIRTSTDTTTWTTRTSNVTSALYKIDYGNGKWIVAGGDAGGTLIESTDAITWATLLSVASTSGIFRSIKHSGTSWLAGTSNGIFYLSTDGTTWTSNSTSGFGTTTSENIRYNIYENGIWVAAGSSGSIKTSTDNTTWIDRTSNFGTTQINMVAYGNGLWTAVGNTGQIRTSTNAITWVTQTSNFGTTNIAAIKYGNGTWVALGRTGNQVRYSTDAVIWSTGALNVRNNFTMYDLEFAQNQFYAVGQYFTFMTSTNGVLWKDVSPTNVGTVTSMQSIKYGNGVWVVGGANRQLLTNQDSYSSVRPPLVTIAGRHWQTWVTRTSNFGTTTIRGVSFGNGLWVAVGDSGQIRTSTDTVTWNTQTSNFGTSAIRDVAFGNNLFVAVGDGGAVRTSTNGTSWVTVTSQTSSTLNKVAFASNTWVAGGVDLITSTDASTWVTRTSNFGASQIGSIAYGGASGIWVAGGVGGQIRTSTNAITWVTRTSGVAVTINGIVNHSATLVYVADAGNIRWSTNGVSWTAATSRFSDAGTGTVNDVYAVASNGTLLLAGATENRMRTTRNPTTWATQFPAEPTLTNHIRGVAFANNTWIAVGDNGYIQTANELGSRNQITVTVADGGIAEREGTITVVRERLD